MKTNAYLYNISLVILGMGNISKRTCGENHKTQFMSNNFSAQKILPHLTISK